MAENAIFFVYICKFRYCGFMLNDLIKALIVGICAAVPVGPVLILILQKTLRRGRWAGTVAGIGSALGDAIYAAIGLFTISLLSDFINDHAALIMILGGALVAVIGITIFLKDASSGLDSEESHFTMAGYAVQTLGCVMSNPAALAVMIALLSVFGLDAHTTAAPVWAVVLCVFGGEFLYWYSISALVGRFMRVKPRTLKIFSKICGAVIAVFGIVLIVKGIISIL